MRLRFFGALALSLLAVSCGNGTWFRSYASNTVEVRLIPKVSFSEKKSDTQIISFGTAHVGPHLLSGWSDPQNDLGTPFQWAITQDPVFTFETDATRPLYLHLKLRSASVNPAAVSVNSRQITNITVDNEKEYFSVFVPLAVLLKGTNRVQFHFAALHDAKGAMVAAAFYAVLITPSKYVVQFPRDYSPDQFWSNTFAWITNKNYPALSCKTGGSFFFYEKLNHNTTLQFGYRYHPSPFAEKDDYAAFTVLLRKDGGKKVEIFSRQVADESLQQVHLPLGAFISDAQPAIYELEFRVDRSSIFDSSQTAWLLPTLAVDAPHEPKQVDDKQALALKKLRADNRSANVLLIVLDAGGAKHFGCYGYPRNTTPVIDQLAREGFRFTRAYSQAVFTMASTATLMSGLLPEHHRILYLKNKLPSDLHTLAEVFRSNGYETATFVANGNASSTFGMAQGFNTVGEVFRDANYTGWGQDVTNHFTKWLDQHSQERFFVYMHYREPHDPYNPPEEWVRKFADPAYSGNIGRTFQARIKIKTNDPNLTTQDHAAIQALYDANLSYGDFQVGQVLKKLRELGIDRRTMVIVTADHGEAFWEHGFQGHNAQVYQESIHIPLVIRMPHAGSAWAKIDPVVRTVDLFPTLTDLFGFSRKGVSMDGRSFLPYFVSGPSDDREVVSQTTRERAYSYLDGDYHYITDLVYGREELYNVKADPDERHNLMPVEPVRARYYRQLLLAHLAAMRRTGQKAEQAVIDESARENLKALGYIEE